MLENRRSYLALVLAALLPIVLFASAIALIVGFREQSALEASALSKVREIASGIDRYVAAQLEGCRDHLQGQCVAAGRPRAIL